MTGDDVKFPSIREGVLYALAAGKPLTRDEIREAAGFGNRHFSKTMWLLVQEGRIVKLEGGAGEPDCWVGANMTPEVGSMTKQKHLGRAYKGNVRIGSVPTEGSPAYALLQTIKAHHRWVSRDQWLQEAGVADRPWNQAIAHLRYALRVEGQLRGNEEFYRAIDPEAYIGKEDEKQEEIYALLTPLHQANSNRRSTHSNHITYLQPNESEQDEDPILFNEQYEPADSDTRERVDRSIKVRRGQQAFRTNLRNNYGDICMISGCTLLDLIEAAHIKPYRGKKDNGVENGLLLRADLHTLFDLDLIGIEPETLVVKVHPRAQAAGYNHFDGKKLYCSSGNRPSERALRDRWKRYKERLRV